MVVNGNDQATTARASRWWRWRIAGLWGLAESTLWFVVPDVFLSALATRFRLAQVWAPTILAALAATLGGALIYAWAQTDPGSVYAVFDAMPAISAELLAAATVAMAAVDWPIGLVKGAFSGTPYKTFAAGAGVVERDLITFLAVSAPARLLRFAVVVGATAYLRMHFRLWGIERMLLPTVLIGWVGFYAWFWTVMPN